MNSSTWITCSDPAHLLAFVLRNASARKLRLLACACCRQHRDFDFPALRKAVGVAEQFADGAISPAQFRSAARAVRADFAKQRSGYDETCGHWLLAGSSPPYWREEWMELEGELRAAGAALEIVAEDAAEAARSCCH